MPYTSGKLQDLANCGEVTLGLLSSLQGDNRILLPTVIHFGTGAHELLALVDSGAAENFIDKTLITSLSLETHALDCPVRLISVDNRPLSQDLVLQSTNPFQLQLGALHCRFHVLSLTVHPLL